MWHLNHCRGSIRQSAAGPHHHHPPHRAGEPWARRAAEGTGEPQPIPEPPLPLDPHIQCQLPSPVLPQAGPHQGTTLVRPTGLPCQSQPLCLGLDRAPAGSPGGDDPKAPTSPGWGSSPASRMPLHFHQLRRAHSPLRGLQALGGQTPHCPGCSPRAQGKGKSFPVFVIILGSKFSSFVLFFPIVVALTASSPSEVWDPPTHTHPQRGGTKPSFNQSRAAGQGRRRVLSRSLWRRILFSPAFTSAASPSGTRRSHMSRRSLVPAVPLQSHQPEGHTRLRGQSRDPASGNQTFAPHPGRAEDPPSTLPSSLQPKLLNPVRGEGSRQPLTEGWDKVRRRQAKRSRICPTKGAHTGKG